jgi:hypothetical protein
MKKRIVASIFFLTLLCSTFSVAQPLFKVEIDGAGNYTLIKNCEGVDGRTLTALLLRATDNRDAINAAEILERCIQARENGDEKRAALLQNEWDQEMACLGSKVEWLPIKNPFVLSSRNLLLQQLG